MRLDVLMPVYGDAPYLCESIISVLEDIQNSDKLIIILDRTSSGVLSIVNFYSKIDRRIQVIGSSKPGISSALNEGIRVSTADLLGRIDCDDIVLADRFNLQRRFLMRRTNYVLVGSNYFNIDENGFRYKSTILPSGNFSIKNIMKIKNPIAHPSVMYRRNAVINAGGYNSDYDGIEDLELWGRLKKYGKFKNLNRRLIEYRSSAYQTTKNLSSRVLAQKKLKLIADQNKVVDSSILSVLRNRYEYTSFLYTLSNLKLQNLRFSQIAKLSIIDSKLFMLVIYNLFSIKIKSTVLKIKK